MTEQEKQEWREMKVQKIEVSPEAQKKIVEMINNPRPITEEMQRLLDSRNALSESFTRGAQTIEEATVSARSMAASLGFAK